MIWLIRSGIKQEQRANSQVWDFLYDSYFPMLASGIFYCIGLFFQCQGNHLAYHYQLSMVFKVVAFYV